MESSLLYGTLDFATVLLTETAAKFSHSKTISKRVVSRLKPHGSLADTFCRNAALPNLKWGFDKGVDSQTIDFVFRDGETELTSGKYTLKHNGEIEYNFKLVNPETIKKIVSTRGFFNPNKPMISSNSHGVGYSWENGYLTIHTHSSGFSNDTTTDKKVLINIGKRIQEFFIRISQNRKPIDNL